MLLTQRDRPLNPLVVVRCVGSCCEKQGGAARVDLQVEEEVHPPGLLIAGSEGEGGAPQLDDGRARGYRSRSS